MNHSELLLELFKEAEKLKKYELSDETISYLETITHNLDKNKGVYTVLVTLMVHKLLYPKQDIRFFQEKMENGFSARTVDTKYITPTLKSLGVLSMAESGWLTRSLEQPYPYTMDYKGEISGKGMKKAFLEIVDTIERYPQQVKDMLLFILHHAIIHKEKNTFIIEKIDGSDWILISEIVDILDIHFSIKYWTHGGSKLPVLAFYSIYKSLIAEIWRYNGCNLEELGSHTASDRTSKSAWDIEVTKDGKIFEAVEVKLDKEIDINMARIAYEKIQRFNPKRYYILSYIGIKEEDEEAIQDLILDIQLKHWCQLITNWLLHTLKYYLRLISNPKDFFNRYIELVEADKELKPVHKATLQKILEEYKVWNQ